MGQGAGSARLKLLIDEMYSPAIAEQLRDRERDAEAVTERPELRALADTDIFALAQHEQRAVVTENIDDFSVIADSYDQRGQTHFGLVLVPHSNYSRSPRTIGRMVTELDRLLGEHPGAKPRSMRHWL
jgi:predicted nuclease of predicted toxin-antitoxin system